jgi:phosphoribosylglycinamide formyltransferase 1
MRKLRVGVLISGRGSNMKALVEAGKAPDYPAEVVFVLSNVPDAAGLDYAKEEGIATAVVDHRQHGTRESFDAYVHAELLKNDLQLVCCAGFMRIMTPVLLRPWEGRMLNIHPSLLPLYKGLHTHARALADGATEHGASVHFVMDELDGGEVIAQAKVPVLPGDTPETLAARVLAVEHPLYVEALKNVASKIIQPIVS